MTFINRRIIKRPTLFVSSRRNFGNLLTHYETGQDGTTPEPGPDPDPTTPISFTVSWATNGGIIQANLVGIQDGDGTEIITLTRDDGRCDDSFFFFFLLFFLLFFFFHVAF